MTPELAIISALAGIALGLRYKVMVLIPAMIFAMMFAITVGIARADHFWSMILAMVIVGTAVQLGYLAGIAIRAAFESIFSAVIKSWKPQFRSEIGRT